MSTPFDSLFDGLAHLEEHINPSVHLGLQDCFRAIEQAVVAFEAAGSAPLWTRFFVERLERLLGSKNPHRKTVQALVDRLTQLLP
jgi:hypothetical protein